MIDTGIDEFIFIPKGRAITAFFLVVFAALLYLFCLRPLKRKKDEKLKEEFFYSGNDLVSIILPVYNSKKYIQQTVLSILNQSYKNWELIICDDCSNDGTRDMMIEIADSDPRIKVLFNDVNEGVAFSRNRCLLNANGEYICFIDSDDLWPVDKIEYQLSYMKQNDSKITCGDFADISDPLNGYSYIRRCKKISDLDYLLKNNYILFQTVMINKIYKELIEFKKIPHEDFILAIDLVKSGVRIHGINKVLSYRRRRHDSLTSNKIRSAKWRWNIYRKYLNFDLIQASYYFSNYILLSFYFVFASAKGKIINVFNKTGFLE